MSNKRSTTPESAASTHSVYSRPTLALLASLGLMLLLIGSVMPLLGSVTLYRWIYAVGAVMVLVCRLFSPYHGDNMRVKRLVRIESWSAIFFCVAVFFMFYPSATMRDWLSFTMAGAVIQIYTSIMIPREARKENNK